MRIFHLSDLHLTQDNKPVFGLIDPRRNFLLALESIRAILLRCEGPHLLLITGDLGESGHEAVYGRLRDDLADFPIPYLLVLGNHDDRQCFRRVFCPVLPLSPESGFINYSFDSGNFRFLILDSVIEGSDRGRLAPETLAWLRDQLLQAGNRRLVLAFHHPFGQKNHWFMQQLALQNADALLQELAPYRAQIELLCCGHNHLASIHDVGLPLATAPSTCFLLSPSYSADDPVEACVQPPSYFIHSLSRVGLSHSMQVVSEPGTQVPAVKNWELYISSLEKQGVFEHGHDR